MFEIEYDLNEDDIVHFNEKRFIKSEVIRKKLRMGQLIAPAILVIIGIFYGLILQNLYAGMFTVVCAIIITFVTPYFVKRDMRKQVIKQYTDEEKASIFGHYKLKIEGKYLLENSPSGENTMPWEEILRVEYGDRYVYIFLDIATALVIPVRKITRGNLEAFAEQAEKLIDRYS